MAAKIRRGALKITNAQLDVFIDHLSISANVTASAEMAGFHRSRAHIIRADRPEFAARWEDALEQATDALQAEARRRAHYGVKEPVISMGRIVMDPEDETGRKPLYVHRYSDSLMQMLLKAHRPGMFNPPTQLPGSGVAMPADLQPDPKPVPDEPGPEKPVV